MAAASSNHAGPGLRLQRKIRYDARQAAAAARGKFPGRVAAAITGRRWLHCLGDSHVEVFRDIRRRRLLPRTWVDVVKVPGATAYGLANLDSVTGTRRLFDRRLALLEPGRTVVTMLGEVDAGYLAWELSASRGTSVEAELTTSFERYVTYLDRLRGRFELVVASVILPSVDDYTTWVSPSPRYTRDIDVPVADRAESTMLFNRWLRSWCAEQTVAFLDYEAILGDTATGLLADRFRVDPPDPHLEADAFAEVVAAELRALGYR